jgi:erythronate-4-phosphate dehydrogenase
MKIVADDRIPFLKGVMESFAEVVYLPGAQTAASDVRDADAIITRTRTKCNAALLTGSNVRLIATATIGYDHIDAAFCEAAGIRWVNAPGCNSRSVQQYITAALTAFVYKSGLRFGDLTLGVIGVGNVGSKVAAAAEALGMRVLINDPPRADREGAEAFTPLDELLNESDIVTLHVPLEKAGDYPTFHFADRVFFEKMKSRALFINSSRGGVVDTEEFKAAAADKHFTWIFDVWEHEPDIDAELLEHAFIATPHIAGYSADGKANGTAACVREVCRFFGIDKLAKDWYPAAVPAAPFAQVIEINGEGRSREEILFETVSHTYPILEDKERLQSHPERFEELRGKYWTRREFSFFTVKPQNVSPDVIETLEKLGFGIKVESRK